MGLVRKQRALDTELLETISDWVLDSKAILIQHIEDFCRKRMDNDTVIHLDDVLTEEEEAAIELGEFTREETLEDTSVPFSYAVTRKHQHHVTCYMSDMQYTVQLDKHNLQLTILLKGMYDNLDEKMEWCGLHRFNIEELAQLAAHLVAHESKLFGDGI